MTAGGCQGCPIVPIFRCLVLVAGSRRLAGGSRRLSVAAGGCQCDYRRLSVWQPAAVSLTVGRFCVCQCVRLTTTVLCLNKLCCFVCETGTLSGTCDVCHIVSDCVSVCRRCVRLLSELSVWSTLVPGVTTNARFNKGHCFVCQSVCLTVCLRLQCVRLTVCLSRKSKGFFRRLHFAGASVYPLVNYGN